MPGSVRDDDRANVMNARAHASRAAIDVGSNSVRLLVVDARGGRITRQMAITRLARGIDRSGRFDDRAFEDTIAAIVAFTSTAREHAADGNLRIAATSAVRDAADRQRFVTAVWTATGLAVEVLSGEEEAALAFAGAAGAVGANEAVVVDIGGGSTEIVVGRRHPHVDEIVASVSMQMGCVRMTERHLATDPPTRDERLAVALDVAGRLDAIEPAVALKQLGQGWTLVAVAGTATTIGALHLGLDHYDEDRIHGTRVPAAAVSDLAQRLMGMSAAQRQALGPMQSGREDVIHAGALILDAIVRRGGFAEVVISEADSLDGLVGPS